MRRINASRLWDSLNQMATLGAIPGNGVCRLALSEEDRQARDLLQRWAIEAGCTVRVDEMGNMFLRREGRQPQLAPVLTGSHVDSQPNGGRYDGIYGVLAGLEVLRSLNDAQVSTERAIPDARATVGRADIEPNSPNVVPGRVRFSIEFRHPDEQVLAEMGSLLLRAFTEINNGQLIASVERIFDYAPVEFDAHCVATVRQAATTLGYAQREMISGAGHDACYLSRVAPTAMIFIPCVDGISHNPAENISEAWASAGANVLLNAVVSSAMEE